MRNLNGFAACWLRADYPSTRGPLAALQTAHAMPIQGISHVTFIVRDLARMTAFLCGGLGAVEVYDSQGKNFSLSRKSSSCSAACGWPPWKVSRRSSAPTAISRSRSKKMSYLNFNRGCRRLGSKSKHPGHAWKVRVCRCTSMTSITTCSSCTPVRWSNDWRAMHREIRRGTVARMALPAGDWLQRGNAAPAAKRVRATGLLAVAQQHGLGIEQKFIQMQRDHADGDWQLQRLIVMNGDIAKADHAFKRIS